MKKVVKFKDLDLEFENISTSIFTHWQARIFYPNGFGASVITGDIAYGGRGGLFELAVLKGTADESTLCYDTQITNDVLGRLQPQEVKDLLVEIEALDED